MIITCVIAFREDGDKIMSVGLGGGMNHRLLGDISQTVGDVLLNRPGKQRRLLTHKSHLQKKRPAVSFCYLMTCRFSNFIIPGKGTLGHNEIHSKEQQHPNEAHVSLLGLTQILHYSHIGSLGRYSVIYFGIQCKHIDHNTVE